ITVGKGKAAVDLWLVCIFRCEKRVEVFLAVDLAGMCLAERLGAFKEVTLHLVEKTANSLNELCTSQSLLLARVTAGNKDGVAGDVPRANFDAKRHPLLDPLPVLLATTQVAIVEDDLKRPAIPLHGLELFAQALAMLKHFA